MMYYIMLPGDTESDLVNDINQLGEATKFTFTSNTGYKALKKIVNLSNGKLAEQVVIRSSDGGTHTIEEFLNIISKLRLIENYGV